MVKNWIVVIVATLIALLIALSLLRWLAPGLVGAPVDMRLVRADDAQPASGVFATPEGRLGP